MATRKRVPLNGSALAFITTTVRDWTPVFKSESCAKAVLDQLQETAGHYQVSIVAFVLMPSHVHLLLGFPRIAKMSDFMKSFKRMSTRRLMPLLGDGLVSKFKYGGSFRLWQPRFDDVIIWSEEQFKIKVEYIHNNPVKAGLVSTATDYNWSSAVDWLSERRGYLPVEKEWSWQKEN